MFLKKLSLDDEHAKTDFLKTDCSRLVEQAVYIQYRGFVARLRY
jgi:hypothetical protein